MLNCTLCIEDSFENGWFHRTRELLGKSRCAFLKNDSLSDMEKLAIAAGKLEEKELRWKIFYASPESDAEMNRSFQEIPDFNNDFSGEFRSFQMCIRDRCWRIW